MSVLEKPCPKCKGRGRVPNLLLPGSHVCRRCDGQRTVPTIWGRLAEHALKNLAPETEE